MVLTTLIISFLIIAAFIIGAVCLITSIDTNNECMCGVGAICLVFAIALLAGSGIFAACSEKAYEPEHVITMELLPLVDSTYIVGYGSEIKGLTKYQGCVSAGGHATKYIDFTPDKSYLDFDDNPRAEIYNIVECAKTPFGNLPLFEYEHTKLFVPEYGYKRMFDTL